MKKGIRAIREWIESRLRKVCGNINPDRRVTVIVIIFAVFALVNLWVMFSSIYNIGREDEQNDVIRITPIKVPDYDFKGEEPSDMTRGMQEYFNRNFKEQEHDSTTIEQEQPES